MSRPRVGVLIGALTYYKLLGPVIDEALADGVEVVLLLRDAPELRQGPKSYLRPTPDNVPAFRSGQPRVVSWDSDASLLAACDREGLQALISVWLYPRDFGLCRAVRARGIRWVAVQVRIEPFVMGPETFLEADVHCVFSRFWIEHGKAMLQRAGGGQEACAALEARAVVTGCPEVEPFDRLNRQEVRSRYGVPQDRPVVVWLPHDYHDRDLWELLVFRRRWHPRVLWRAVRQRRLDLLLRLWTGTTHRQLIRQLRAWCDQQGAFLLVKSRPKDFPPEARRFLATLCTFDRSHYPAAVAAAADLFLEDQTYYPSMMLEVLAMADLVIHVFSVTALEAAYAGVPALCLVPPAGSTFFDEPNTWQRMPPVQLHGAETIWGFPGVSTAMDLEEAVRRLPGLRLAQLRVDPVQRRRYLERFLGPTDGRSARRILEAALQPTPA